MSPYNDDRLGTSSSGAPAHSPTRTGQYGWENASPRVTIGPKFRLGLRVAESYLLSRKLGYDVETAVFTASARESITPAEVFRLLEYMGVNV